MAFLRIMAALAATTALSIAVAPARAQSETASSSGSGVTPGIDLSIGVSAPSLDVGTTEVQAGTLQYTNQGGMSDSFSVGTSTSIGANASASSTPDYGVTSTATFGVGSSVVNQNIGTMSDEMGGGGTISGDFTKTVSTGGTGVNTGMEDITSNIVSVGGIGGSNEVNATAESGFKTDIAKIPGVGSDSAGTASGSAAGSVSTTASANANSSQFISSFIQAY